MPAPQAFEGEPCWIKTTDFVCAGVGIFMVVIGGLKYANHYDDLSLGQFVTNFYAIVLGLIVTASALGVTWLQSAFGFTFRWIGRGFFYLF
eukprot:SAG22_NODE_5558_length_993_cov_0.876957_1_plen_90_part_10